MGIPHSRHNFITHIDGFMELTRELRERIEARARAAGFDLAGVASVPESDGLAAEVARQRFEEWIATGRSGEMEWLKRTDDAGKMLRGDLRRAMPWARSVLVCALNYNADAPLSIDPADGNAGWIARYAWSGDKSGGEGGQGADYHDVLLVKLRKIEAELKQQFGDTCQTRCYVDTGPIVERGYAERAGIGWIGKNTCVLNQDIGSWLLLGVIVMSLPLGDEATILPAADRCGSCTRCIDACPTDALIAPRQMDASRCISYLTIEKKGNIAEELRAKIGRQVFGCDICQDVCPWNDRAPIALEDSLGLRGELVNPALEWLAGMDAAEFKRRFRGSPLERTGRKRLVRNVAIAMGNSGEREFLPRLLEWSESDDAVLAEAAEWATQRLSERLESSRSVEG
ncbi:MAG: tRNA epoxyqueuosine(34) reductase QueG [Acidobacteriota bacterium]|nr:tRNA epoxyqueuosine(34) reductase QueG [Acidobacteriota bacterium]